MSVNSQREMNRRILERIASDTQFREELLDDPRGAMEKAGFSWESTDGDDVSGYGLFQTTAITCPDPIVKGGDPVASTAITCPDPGPKGGGTGWTDPAPGPVNS